MSLTKLMSHILGMYMCFECVCEREIWHLVLCIVLCREENIDILISDVDDQNITYVFVAKDVRDVCWN